VEKPTSSGAVAAAYVLAAVAFLGWLILLPGLADLNGSDAAGNAMSQGFAALQAIALWVVLAILALLCLAKGQVPTWASLAAVLLVPGSGVAAIAAFELLSQPELPPYLWPLAALAAPPPLIVAFCLWAVTPPLRAWLPANAVSVAVWGAVAALSVSIAPMQAMRAAVLQKQAGALAAWRAEVVATPADAPLWQWTSLLGRGFYAEDDVIAKIRDLDRRQGDAETMLKRGDFPLAYLSRFALDATPAVCEGARAELQSKVAPLIAAKPQARPYADVADKVDAAVAAMSWLVGYGCPMDAESLAWQTMAEGYRDPGWSIHELADLRDPKALGRTLRDSPEKFSQLGPQARLWAWLSFADRPETRDAAIASARQTPGRTDDAVQMLEDKNWGPGIFVLIAAIPSLDLDATPRLCVAALAHVREDDLDKVYRPTADDPRPYSELLERLGAGEPLTALQWLAGHGCDAEAELGEAEQVVAPIRIRRSGKRCSRASRPCIVAERGCDQPAYTAVRPGTSTPFSRRTDAASTMIGVKAVAAALAST
jgi:hypothetical protein